MGVGGLIFQVPRLFGKLRRLCWRRCGLQLVRLLEGFFLFLGLVLRS